MEPFPIAAPAFPGDSRSVPAGNAFAWLRSGWAIFVAAPGVWVVIALIVLVGNLLLSMVPLLGQVASMVLAPMLTAGALHACRNAGSESGPQIADLFWAFSNRTGPLATTGLLYTAGFAALVAFSVLLVGGGAFAGALFGGARGAAGAVGGGVVAGLVAALIVLLASIPLFMAIWFAPALVAFNGMSAVDALRASFFACLKNIAPITVFSLVFMVAAVFATLLAGLGWLLLLPIVFGALYASYRDVFPDRLKRMQTQIVPTARGWRWLAEGFALFRRNPPALALLVVLYWLLMAVINVVPVVGPVIASICIPVFSVGLMNACREVARSRGPDEGGLVGVGFLFSAFRPNPAPLFLLGAAYLALTLLILAASSLADGGTLMQLMLGQDPPREALENPAFLIATQLALVLLLPVVMAYWYAPVLVAWHGFSPAKALFFSFFACLRNWRAFLAYGISLAVWGVILPGMLLGILAGLISGTQFVVALLSAPVLLILAPTVFASFYVTYRDVFAVPEHVDVRA